MNKSKALISPVYDRFNFSLTWQPLTQAVTPLTPSSFQCSPCHPLIQIPFFPLFPVMLTLSSNSSFQWRNRSRLQGGGPISPPEEDSSRLRWSASFIYRLDMYPYLCFAQNSLAPALENSLWIYIGKKHALNKDFVLFFEVESISLLQCK